MQTRLTMAACLLLPLLSLLPGCERSVPPSEPGHAASAEAPLSSGKAPSTPQSSALADIFTALPAGNLAVESPAVSAYLKRYFDAACAPDERVSFERICQHYAAPMANEAAPSPWPDIVLGIDAGRIVSIVLTTPGQIPGEGWRCAAPADVDGVLVCYTTQIADADRQRWSAQWATYFNAAG